MKTKVFLIILAITFGIQSIYAQEIIYGGPVEGVWSYDKSPYIIRGSIYIDEFNSLIIEPGVEVIFETTDPFYVNGVLIAEGTESDTILFTTNKPDRGWGGLIISTMEVERKHVLLAYCKFEYAGFNEFRHYKSGGAIRITNTLGMTIQNCLFEYNKITSPNPENDTEARNGGAMAIINSQIRLSKNVFRYNEARNGGALLIDNLSDVVVDNSLFYGNTSDHNGGAVYVANYSSADFVNTTFADNYANNMGGALSLTAFQTVSVTNSILWNNTALTDGNQAQVGDNSSLSLRYTNIEGGLKGIAGISLAGDDQVFYDVDPLFQHKGIFPYTFAIASPCVNKGTSNPDILPQNYRLPPTDLAGHSRVTDQLIDLGYYECPAQLQTHIQVEQYIDHADGGPVKWDPQTEIGTGRNLLDVYFQDDNKGWVIAEGGTLFSTKDGGNSWSTHFFGAVTKLKKLQFTDETTGFLAGTVYVGPSIMAVCFKTTDGGDTWDMIFMSETSVNVNSMAFVDGRKGYILGQSVNENHPEAVIISTTDAGETWSENKLNKITTNITNMLLSEDGSGWMTVRMEVGPTEVSAILKTEDKGENWSAVYYGNHEALLQSVDFSNNEFGMASGSDGTLLVTEDRGRNWVQHRLGEFDFNDLIVTAEGKAWLVGEHGVILTSSDHGGSWHQDQLQENVGLNSIFRTPSGDLWIAGDEGTLLVQRATREMTDETVAIEEDTELIAHGTQPLLGHGNYPNPFDDQTTITFELESRSKVQLHIYSPGGQLIRTMLDQQLEAGAHQAIFEVENLPPGIYFYVLSAGSSREFGKMVLSR
jgi:photosystem II stability/assembly factor-like uncharacterized protein